MWSSRRGCSFLAFHYQFRLCLRFRERIIWGVMLIGRGPQMRRLKPRVFLAGGSALVLLSAGTGTSWGLTPQPPSEQVEAEEPGDAATGAEAEADASGAETTKAEATKPEAETAAAPETASPQGAGGTGASQATSSAPSEDPPLGSSGNGGTGGNGRPTQDPDKPI